MCFRILLPLVTRAGSRSWPPPTGSSAAWSSCTGTGSCPATTTCCAAVAGRAHGRWSSPGSRAAGTPTADGCARAPSTTPWTSSTTARTRSSRAGTWPRCAPPRRWRAAGRRRVRRDLPRGARRRAAGRPRTRCSTARYYQQQVIPPARLRRHRARAALRRHGRRAGRPTPIPDRRRLPARPAGRRHLRPAHRPRARCWTAGTRGPRWTAIRELNYMPGLRGLDQLHAHLRGARRARAPGRCRYPKGRPSTPCPTGPRSWTGLEYVSPSGLIQQGRADLAEDVVAAVRERLRGARRNPFDEAECGHHYARAMASWGLIVALTGFRYDGRDGHDDVRRGGPARPAGSGRRARPTACCTRPPGGTAALEVVAGSVRVDQVVIGGRRLRPKSPGTLTGITDLEPAG